MQRGTRLAVTLSLAVKYFACFPLVHPKRCQCGSMPAHASARTLACCSLTPPTDSGACWWCRPAADLTYGVVCEPAPGSVDNMHANSPWLKKTRLPLKPFEKEEGCYSYTMTASDTFASVAGELLPCLMCGIHCQIVCSCTAGAADLGVLQNFGCAQLAFM